MYTYQKEVKIYNEVCRAQVFVDAGGEEWVRFMVEGCWHQQPFSKTDERIHINVNTDNSVCAVVQKLIPVDRVSNNDWMTLETGRMLNFIERTLELGPDSLSSSQNWAGHSSTQWDCVMSAFDQAIVGGKTMRAIMPLNTFANICGYFFNHCRDEHLCDHATVNNGYNCAHPDQEEVEDGIGSCYAWSCPLCCPSDGIMCGNCGVQCEECGIEECECDDDYVVATIPESLFNAGKMFRYPDRK